MKFPGSLRLSGHHHERQIELFVKSSNQVGPGGIQYDRPMLTSGCGQLPHQLSVGRHFFKQSKQTREIHTLSFAAIEDYYYSVRQRGGRIFRPPSGQFTVKSRVSLHNSPSPSYLKRGKCQGYTGKQLDQSCSFFLSESTFPFMLWALSRRSSILTVVTTLATPSPKHASCIFFTTARILSRSPSKIVPIAVNSYLMSFSRS